MPAIPSMREGSSGIALAFEMRIMRTSRMNVGGFTLVELLTVVAIVGILLAIALPQFAARQGAAFDARVESEVRLAAVAQEAYYVNALSYSSDCTTLPGFTPSQGVYFPQCAGDPSGFVLEGDHPNSNQTCLYDSGANPSMTCAHK
jgi:prepilin-type N-terminal cleavage/methylation domain-containing protein